MREFPAVFSLPLFSSISKSLNAFTVNFRDKRTRQNFITLATSILHSGTTLLSEAGKVSSVSKNLNKALSNFLQSNSWQTAVLNKMRLSLINKFWKDIRLIALDFTALCKVGKHFEYLSRVYDGRDGTIKPGYSFLLALGISEDTTIKLPLLDKLISYEHNFQSENLEIIKFLNRLKLVFQDKLKNIIFLADRGFDRETIIKKFLNEQWHFIVQAKKNKRVRLADNRKSLMAYLDAGFYENVWICSWEIVCNIKVEMVYDKKDKVWKRFIWLTDLNEKQFSITKVYRKRWKIDDGIKEIKGNYGLEKFRVRSFQAIERLISLALFCYTLFTTLSLSKTKCLNELRSSVAELAGFKRIITSKTIKLLRDLAEIINNFALIVPIQRRFGLNPLDYG